MKKIKLLTIYAKDYLFFSGTITLLCLAMLSNTGLRGLSSILWLKVITSIIGFLVHQKRKAKEIFFYMNQGLGKKELTIYAFVLDFSLWLLGIIGFINLIR